MPKYVLEGRNEGGRVASHTSVSKFDSYDKNSLPFRFDHGIFTDLWQGLKIGMPIFQLFYEIKLKTYKFKVLSF